MEKTNSVDDLGSAIKMIQTRLDAIVLLLLSQRQKDDEGPKISEAAPLLHSLGYTPTEIAKMFGKRRAQDVASYLYKKSDRVEGDLKGSKSNRQ